MSRNAQLALQELVVDRKETRAYLYRNNHQKRKESGLYHLNASDIAMEIYVTQATSAIVITFITFVSLLFITFYYFCIRFCLKANFW